MYQIRAIGRYKSVLIIIFLKRMMDWILNVKLLMAFV
ncbi:UNVERIFIED_CONTAM: hypothetical protein GTU68_003646 [Idotea baltica]|nr:hypothetical protein [Idotea baltica]